MRGVDTKEQENQVPDTTVTQTGWEITEHRTDGCRYLRASIDNVPVWIAWELLWPVGGHKWQIHPCGISGTSFPAALVWDEPAARAWLEHEAQHALLAAKVVAA